VEEDTAGLLREENLARIVELDEVQEDLGEGVVRMAVNSETWYLRWCCVVQ
jgi:hypothetical protein